MYVENKYTAETQTNRIVPTQPTDRPAAAITRLYGHEQTVFSDYAETANTATGVGEDDLFGQLYPDSIIELLRVSAV
jgi:hypothetical protein